MVGAELLFLAAQQRQLSPFPQAIDISETDLAEPAQLCLNVQ